MRDAEGAAERAQQAAGLGGGFGEGPGVGILQQGFEVAGGGGGFGDAVADPGVGAGQAHGRRLRRRCDWARGSGARCRQGVAAPAVVQGLETAGDAAEAVVEQEPDGVGQLLVGAGLG